MKNSAHVVGTLLVAAFLLWFPVVARPALGAPTLSSAPAPKAQTAAQRYEELVARVKKGDLDVDFGELRYAYSESTGYRPYGGPAERPVGDRKSTRLNSSH